MTDDPLHIPPWLDRRLEEVVLYDAAAHSPVGASSAYRWFQCPGSVGLISRSGLGDAESSEYAREGTAAHEVASRCLEDGGDAWERAGETVDVDGQGFPVDDEMVECVQLYLDHCRGLVEDAGIADLPAKTLKKLVFVEHRFRLKDVSDQAFGTVDFGLVATDTLHVVDFKYGRGIGVEVEENPQLMYYAAGMLMSLTKTAQRGVRRVVLHVVQPRHDHSDGPVRTWGCTAGALRKWTNETLIPRLTEALERNAPLEPGEWCRFCPAAGVCPAQERLVQEAVELSDQEPSELSDEALGVELDALEIVLRARKRALEDEAFRRIMDGKTVPGWKTVAKRSDRVWREPEDGTIEDLLRGEFGDGAYQPAKLRSPAQLEKLGKEGRAFASEHAYKPDNGVTLAPESDRRPAKAGVTPKEAFENV